MAAASVGTVLLTPGPVVLQIVAAPPSLSITSLHVSHQMSYSISQVSSERTLLHAGQGAQPAAPESACTPCVLGIQRCS
jgi:hypothetical protein